MSRPTWHKLPLRVKLVGGPLDGVLYARGTRAFNELNVPILGGGAFVYQWAQLPDGTPVLACPGTQPLRVADVES